MIPSSEFRERQERALAAAHAAGLEGLVAVGRSFYDRPGALAWLSNHFPPFPNTVFQPGVAGLGHGFLVLSDRGATLLVDGPNYRGDLVAADEVVVWSNLGAGLREVLGRFDRATFGLTDTDLMPLPVWQAVQALPIEWQSFDDQLWQMRRVKSPAEQAALRRATKAADAGL
ncbi:MAG TPA: hypothetical protein DEP84_03580, partial [Chloroflexi bacterium]|nr:hypothetical protein [Chloroflexota bacterium]